MGAMQCLQRRQVGLHVAGETDAFEIRRKIHGTPREL